MAYVPPTQQTSFYSPQISTNYGYPVNPGFQSIRDASGNLGSQFQVTAPQLQGSSNWQALKQQQVDTQNMYNADTARKAAYTQGAPDLMRGRGTAALAGMGVNQQLAGTQFAKQNQAQQALSEEVGKRGLEDAMAQDAMNLQAAQANQKALQGDIDAANKWRALQYANEIKMQMGGKDEKIKAAKAEEAAAAARAQQQAQIKTEEDYNKMQAQYQKDIAAYNKLPYWEQKRTPKPQDPWLSMPDWLRKKQYNDIMQNMSLGSGL